jgi:hypothetical protein
MDAVVTDSFHLIRGGQGSLELFDLANDSLELRNIARLPAMESVVRALTRQMRPHVAPQPRSTGN